VLTLLPFVGVLMISSIGLYLRRKRDGEDFPNVVEAHHDVRSAVVMVPDVPYALTYVQMFGVDLEEPEPEARNESYNEDDYHVRDAPSDYGGSDVRMSDLNGYINVGIVPTTGAEPHATGRIVTFPNWIQACSIQM
jgi:hypothetical protein